NVTRVSQYKCGCSVTGSRQQKATQYTKRIV
ncbi:MAG: hypothetical protein ACJA1Y_000834, partial [Burkholderiaceae bacterium]